MVLGGFWRWCFCKQLQLAGPPSTFVRLLTSRHVKDLQLISECAIAFWLIILYHNRADLSELFKAGKVVDHSLLAAATAVIALILNWVYQTGSKRLGVVDLFACEISAICRTSMVVDFAQLSVTQAKEEAQQLSYHTTPSFVSGEFLPDGRHINGRQLKFTSEEHYTPVYDQTLSDLQPLSVTVVTYVTEFYTYRKAMMDYLRSLYADDQLSIERNARRKMMLYMQFLMYESGRGAIRELIEFEPNREESLINILCSELTLFEYLRAQFKSDPRGDRLRLREDD